MLDQYGRKIDYMRISVTDRCNLRCKYCMPEDGISSVGCHEEMLTYEELVRLCQLFAELGVKKIKITGGEPLVRLGVCTLIRKIKAIEGIEQVTITTNGVLLEQMADELIAAGIDGINISLDTLREEKFAQITRRDRLDDVLRGIDALLERGFSRIKINCVPLVGINEDQIAELALFAKKHPIAIRFIELMPIGYGTEYLAIHRDEVMEKIETAYGKLSPCKEHLGNGPAQYYSLKHFKGRIGFIDAIEHKFCADCNRVRLMANGFLKLCLQYNFGVDLKDVIRSDASDAYLKKVIEKNIYKKPQEHHFCENGNDAGSDNRKMFQVGG